MIYLDNAATSFPKPARVITEQMHCMRSYCGNAGRGSHALALAAAEKIYECRAALSDLFGAAGAERIVFSMNTTTALNTVIKGVLKRGDHVLISDMEHNAVLRPVVKLAEKGEITYTVFPTFPTLPNRTDRQILASILERIRPNTRLLIAAHASNICSATLPIEAIGRLCRERGVLFCVDAAQSAGHFPIDVERMQIDFLCAPGHKGLMGPQGVGILVLGKDAVCDTLIEGGSGYHSRDSSMPDDPPERYEAGTLPLPSIAGLLEGIRELQRHETDAIYAHECELCRRLAARLSKIEGITLYAPHLTGSILLFSSDRIPSEKLGQQLNTLGFCVRAGLHCAPLAHQTLGTPADGAVRVSPSFLNTAAQIDAFADAVESLLRLS